jgi:DNA uptake protein ComE-like DNA-binding protein
MGLAKWLSSGSKLAKNLDLERKAIAMRIERDPYYRFQSVKEMAIAAELGIKIDVNRANVDDWLRLPGISIHQARSLVELTQRGLQFLCLEDLAAALGLSVNQIKIWQPILYFCYYDSDSLDSPPQINPNSASIEQLQQIPHLEADLAQKILNNRQEQGKYRNLADLQQRLTLNNDLTHQLMYYLKF